MDVVYVVRRSEANEQLRYSLRSLANLPHDRVWIAGYRPSWVAPEVGYMPTIQARSKWENSTANLVTAALNDDVSDRFIYMNDDFHVVEPVEEVEALHRGPVSAVLAVNRYTQGSYVQGMRATRDLISEAFGIEEPLSYELHVPMVLDRELFMDAMHVATELRDGHPMTALHKRTLYGNMHDLGGRQIEDVKAHSSTEGLPGGPYISTNHTSFGGRVGRELRRLFPDPGPYEKEQKHGR